MREAFVVWAGIGLGGDPPIPKIKSTILESQRYYSNIQPSYQIKLGLTENFGGTVRL
jgi:hypothetical protein